MPPEASWTSNPPGAGLTRQSSGSQGSTSVQRTIRNEYLSMSVLRVSTVDEGFLQS